MRRHTDAAPSSGKRKRPAVEDACEEVPRRAARLVVAAPSGGVAESLVRAAAEEPVGDELPLHLADNQCDRACNVPACLYDAGDCDEATVEAAVIAPGSFLELRLEAPAALL